MFVLIYSYGIFFPITCFRFFMIGFLLILIFYFYFSKLEEIDKPFWLKKKKMCIEKREKGNKIFGYFDVSMGL